jgi:F-type H+-transporting ATPase subunit delta
MNAFAHNYARAFLQAAPPDYDVGAFLERADAIARAIVSDARLKGFFSSPSIPLEPKTKALQELGRRVGLDEFGERFLRLLVRRRRLADLAVILSAIRVEWDRKSGIVDARVTVASPVGPDEQASLAEALSRAVGQPVRLSTEVDGRILAGFVARVGSQVFDASVRNAIERFGQRASQSARS